MKRWLLGILILIVVAAGGLYFFNRYWVHRYDALIRRHAAIYRLDPDLVWSIIYQETYFRPWKKGEHGEIGLMQVRPTVGREWAAETGMKDLIDQMERDPESILKDPERNIQIACWYLEKLYAQFRDVPGVEARMVAGYNAGPSRAVEWNRVPAGSPPLDADGFVARIDIPSTRAYTSSILTRFRELKAQRPATASLENHGRLVLAFGYRTFSVEQLDSILANWNDFPHSSAAAQCGEACLTDTENSLRLCREFCFWIRKQANSRQAALKKAPR